MKKYILLTTLAIMVVVFFGPVLHLGRFFLLWDQCFGFYPAYNFVRDSLHQGIIPLWNPYMGCGEPYLADIETGVLYPPNLILLFVPVGLGIVVVTCFHVLLAGVGAYGLSRAWRISPMSSLLAGVTYAFSSYTISHVEFPTELGCAAWFPVCLCALTYHLKRGDIRSLLVLAVALCFQFLAGFPETMAFSLGAMAIYVLFVSIIRWKSSGQWRRLLTPPLGLCGAGAVALLLSMALFLPAWEAFSLSGRAGEVKVPFQSGFLHPLAVFSLLVPSVYGVHSPFSIFWGSYWAPSCLSYWMGAFYVGLVPVAIFMAVGFRRLFGGRLPSPVSETDDEWVRLRYAYCMTILAVFFLYAMGPYTPFYGWCRRAIPFLRHFVTPSKCLLCVVLPLSCLAGIGLDWLANRRSCLDSDRSDWRRILAQWGPTLTFILLGILMLILLVDHGRLGQAALTRFFNLGSVEPRFAHRIPWQTLALDAVKLPIGGLMAALFLYAYVSRVHARGVVTWLIVVLAFADLYITNARILSPGPESVLEGRESIRQRLRPDEKIVRYFAAEHFYLSSLHPMWEALARGRPIEPVGESVSVRSPEQAYEATGRLLRNFSHLYWPVADHVFNANPFSRLASNDIQALAAMLQSTEPSEASKTRLLSMMNCDRVLLWPDLRTLFAEGRLDAPRMIGLQKSLPRAYVAGGVKVLDRREQVLQALAFSPFEPLKEVLIDRGSAFGDTFADLQHVPVLHRLDRLQYIPNGLEIDVSSERPGLLVVSDAHYPGWSATVNGREVPIYKVNYAFRGVRIPFGTSQIKMIYRPMSFRIGVVISLTTFVAIVLLALLWPTRSLNPTDDHVASPQTRSEA